MRAAWMKERYAPAMRAGAWRFVDQLDSVLGQRPQHVFQVGNAEGNVVHAGSAAGYETRNWRIGRNRLEQFDQAGIGTHEGYAHGITCHGLYRGTEAACKEFE